MNPDTLLALSAVEQRALIGLGELSPVELLDASIARIEALNPGVNAICATDFARARAAARAAEAAGARGEPLPLLHGLPLGVKDLLDTAGLLTTCGNTAMRGYVPREDHALVARLRAAGAIVVCKTNTPDLGAGANTRNAVWGATGNPFDPACSAGGSSGGSAVALATGMVSLATGSDTGGSLRIPAAWSGVVGMRPSPGLVADPARTLGWSPLPVLGPMGRCVADTALMLSAMVGLDRRDPLSVEVSPSAFWPLPECDPSTLRVGFCEDFGGLPLDPAIRRVLRARVAALAPQVARVEPVELDLADADLAFDVARAEAFAAAFDGVEPDQLGPNLRANLELAGGCTLADRARAQRAQTRIARSFAAALERLDLIVAPVLPVSPPPWTQLYVERVDGRRLDTYYRWLACCYGVTLAAHPALALPAGRDEAGMPFALQLVGRRHGDATLLAQAAALERMLAADPATARPRPDLAPLARPRPELKALVTHPPVPEGLPGSPVFAPPV
ncbi:amidase [Rubrivivax benzoatilyticus]|nr:amidase family protein [Rubrivivax benzoatilyticus]EGJ11201.1 amidase [Rubrivivax benzoatilyticus JA2 = ATCC BAA-35]